MHLRTIRSAVLFAAGPCFTHRMIVESGNRIPGVSAVFRVKQPLRRCACVPDIRLARMARSEPEDVINYASLLAFGRLRESGRLRRLLPRLSQIFRAEDGRPQMA